MDLRRIGIGVVAIDGCVLSNDFDGMIKCSDQHLSHAVFHEFVEQLDHLWVICPKIFVPCILSASTAPATGWWQCRVVFFPRFDVRGQRVLFRKIRTKPFPCNNHVHDIFTGIEIESGFDASGCFSICQRMMPSSILLSRARSPAAEWSSSNRNAASPGMPSSYCWAAMGVPSVRV